MSLPRLGPHDLHWEFSPGARRLVAYDRKGGQLFGCECRNRTIKDGQYGRDGNLPPGDYLLGPPRAMGSIPFGPYFVPISDFGPNRNLLAHKRSGLGIHGGGSGLERPFAPRQSPPWVPTRGCLRVLNLDLAEIVHLIRAAQRQEGHCYLTVTAWRKGAEEPGDEAPIPAGGLAPGE